MSTSLPEIKNEEDRVVRQLPISGALGLFLAFILSVAATPSCGRADGPAVPFLSQTVLREAADQEGKPYLLGNSNSVLLWEKGCGIATLAMVFQKYGVDTDLIRLNQSLRKTGGFSGPLLNWSNEEAFYQAGQPWIQGIERVNTARPASYRQRVDEELAAGHPVIAFLGAKHYVVLVGKDDKGGYLINDSWKQSAAVGQGIPLKSNAVGLGFDRITQFVFVYPERNAPTNNIPVRGGIANKYFAVGGSRGGLGNPVAAEDPLQGYNASWQPFERGAIFALPQGTYAIYGPVWDKFLAAGAIADLGWPLGDVYSYPSGATVAWQGDFGQGCIIAYEGDPPDQARVYRSDEAFRAQLFANPDLKGTAAYARLDPALLFNWQEGAPGPWVEPDGFSGRWSGKLHVGAPLGWWYSFAFSADDGVRVSIDGRLVLDAWEDGQGRRFTRRLSRGDHWLQVEYRHRQGSAHLMAAWSPWPARPVFGAGQIAGPMEQLPASAPVPVARASTPAPGSTPYPARTPTTAAPSIDFPTVHPEWTSYTNGNVVTDLLAQDGFLWVATTGGVVRWDVRSGAYVKLTTEHGLADNNVRTAGQSPDGTLWFGTAGGLSRLGRDGRWLTLALPDCKGRIDGIIDVEVARDGAIWCIVGGGEVRSIVRLGADGTWTVLKTDALPSGWMDWTPETVTAAPDGSLWFIALGKGVLRLSPNGGWRVYSAANGPASDWIKCSAASPDGTMWFCTDKEGVSRLNVDGQWQTLTASDGLPNNSVRTIAVGRDASVWFAGEFPGVARLSPGGRWETFNTQDGTLEGGRSLALLPDGRPCLFSGGGIRCQETSGNWRALVTDDSLAGNRIRCATRAPDGSLWFGTWGSGVSQITPDGQCHAFDEKNGLASNLVSGIAATADGSLWFATQQGASCLHGDGSWSTLTETDGLAGRRIGAVGICPDGAVWFGSSDAYGDGATRLSPAGQLRRFTTHELAAPMMVQSIACSDDGAVWFGCWSSLSLLSFDGSWLSIARVFDVSEYETPAMTTAPDGAVWGTSYEGVVRVDRAGNVRTFSPPARLTANEIRSLPAPASGILWCEVRDGVSILKSNGSWLTFTTSDGLANRRVRAVVAGPDGALWFATEGGVSRYQPHP